MCGICEFTGYRNDQKAVIERMMKSIEHRGQTVKALFVVARLPLDLEGSVLLTWRMDSSQWKVQMGICRLFLTERFMIIKNCGPN